MFWSKICVYAFFTLFHLWSTEDCVPSLPKLQSTQFSSPGLFCIWNDKIESRLGWEEVERSQTVEESGMRWEWPYWQAEYFSRIRVIKEKMPKWGKETEQSWWAPWAGASIGRRRRRVSVCWPARICDPHQTAKMWTARMATLTIWKSLGAENFMKEAERKEAAKESKTECSRKEAKTEEAIQTEPFYQRVTHHSSGWPSCGMISASRKFPFKFSIS